MTQVQVEKVELESLDSKIITGSINRIADSREDLVDIV